MQLFQSLGQYATFPKLKFLPVRGDTVLGIKVCDLIENITGLKAIQLQ